MATQAVLSERVSLAEQLLQRAERLIGADGKVKLCNKLRSELKFLRRIQSGVSVPVKGATVKGATVKGATVKGATVKGATVKGAHVDSSNLTQLGAVVQSAESLQSVVALLRVYTFTDEQQNKKNLTVDVVADGGLLWVKAVGRKAEALHAVWQGRGQFGDRSVIGQAGEFLLAASQHPLHYTCPRVLFAFYNGVSRPMAQELQRLGISVSGEVVEVVELVGAESEEEESEEEEEESGDRTVHTQSDQDQDQDQDQDLDQDQDQDQGVDEDLDEDLDQDVYEDEDLDQSPVPLTSLDRSQVVTRLSFPAPLAPPSCLRVNLDVSSLLTLVSSLTHGGSGLRFREVVLTEQAASERQAPVLPSLHHFMEGKELMASAAAVKDFRQILDTLGGAKEKERAQSLLRRVTVIPDEPSARTLALTPSAAVTPRSIAIFGTGDTLHAVTMTANRKFVRAAANQGVHFSVFIHEPRALTEGKEWRATPI